MAGLFATSLDRLTLSAARAPPSSAVISKPWSAAGNSPTADSSLVRPPTQSHMGNWQIHLPCSAYFANSLPGLVIATACDPKETLALAYTASTSNMALRVSLVPPDFETTRQ